MGKFTSKTWVTQDVPSLCTWHGCIVSLALSGRNLFTGLARSRDQIHEGLAPVLKPKAKQNIYIGITEESRWNQIAASRREGGNCIRAWWRWASKVRAGHSVHSVFRFKEGSEAAGTLVLGPAASSETYRALAFTHLALHFSSLL